MRLNIQLLHIVAFTKINSNQSFDYSLPVCPEHHHHNNGGRKAHLWQQTTQTLKADSEYCASFFFFFFLTLHILSLLLAVQQAF